MVVVVVVVVVEPDVDVLDAVVVSVVVGSVVVTATQPTKRKNKLVTSSLRIIWRNLLWCCWFHYTEETQESKRLRMTQTRISSIGLSFGAPFGMIETIAFERTLPMRKRILLPVQIAVLLGLPLGLLAATLGGWSSVGLYVGLLLVTIVLGVLSYGFSLLTKKRFFGDMVGYLFLLGGVFMFVVVRVFGTTDTTGWADLGLIVTAMMAVLLGMMSRGWMLVLEWWSVKKSKKKMPAE